MSRKKTGAMVMLGFFVVLGIAATKPPEEHKFKNLKVLPKKISMKELDVVMNGFNDALGVKCGFCHASSMDSSVRHLDFLIRARVALAKGADVDLACAALVGHVRNPFPVR